MWAAILRQNALANAENDNWKCAQGGPEPCIADDKEVGVQCKTCVGNSVPFQNNLIAAGAVLGCRQTPSFNRGSSAPPSTSLAASSVAPGNTS